MLTDPHGGGGKRSTVFIIVYVASSKIWTDILYSSWYYHRLAAHWNISAGGLVASGDVLAFNLKIHTHKWTHGNVERKKHKSKHTHTYSHFILKHPTQMGKRLNGFWSFVLFTGKDSLYARADYQTHINFDSSTSPWRHLWGAKSLSCLTGKGK